MNTGIKDYIKNAILFTKSLVIKFRDSAYVVNEGLKSLNINVSKNPEEWKYYLNISGEKHHTNSPEIYITLPHDNGGEVPYNKESVNNNSFIKKELEKRDYLYKNLIEKNPQDIDYINGCISPVNIEKAISAEDGTILNYNRDLVGANEYTLIHDLETFIKGFMSRWHNRSYVVTDNLYFHSFLGILYSLIPIIVINSKLDKIKTPEVDEFNFYNFLNSNMEFTSAIGLLNNKSKFWLYSNIHWVRSIVGSNKLLDLITDNILAKNSIFLSAYTMKEDKKIIYSGDEKIIEKNTKLYNFIKNSKEKVYNSYPTSVENLLYSNLNSIEKSSDETNLMLENNYLIDLELDKIAKSHSDNLQMKNLSIEPKFYFKNYWQDGVDLVLNYWIFYFKIHKENKIIEEQYSLQNKKNSHTGGFSTLLLMVIKCILDFTGNSSVKIKNLYYRNILPKDIEKFKLILNKLYNDGRIGTYIETINDKFPTRPDFITSKDMFKEYINNIKNYYSNVWLLDSNSESLPVSSIMKMVFRGVLEHGYVKISEKDGGETIDEILEKYNIVYRVEEGSAYTEELDFLFNLGVGMGFDINNNERFINENIKSFLNNFLSYITPVIYEHSTTTIDMAYYNNISSFNTRNGLIRITDSIFKNRENNKIFIQSKSFSSIEITSGIHILNEGLDLALSRRTIDGFVEVIKGPLVLTSPSYDVELLDKFVFDTKNSPHEDIVILRVQDAIFTPTSGGDPQVIGGGDKLVFNEDNFYKTITEAAEVGFILEEENIKEGVAMPEIDIDFI